jgi:hypothetical protein
MGRHALVAALVALVLVTGSLWAGEKERRGGRKREPVPTADYLKAVQTLVDVADELEQPEAANKGQELRDRVKTAAESLRLGGRGLEKMLAIEDNKALAARLKSYAYNSVRGKVNYERQQVIKNNPDLKAEYEKIQDKEKALADEKEAFYESLRPKSQDLDQLAKLRDALAADRERQREEARRKKREGKPKGGRSKKKGGDM